MAQSLLFTGLTLYCPGLKGPSEPLRALRLIHRLDLMSTAPVSSKKPVVRVSPEHTGLL